ncbi:EVE domain-containing protein [Pokkaliibacter plantistimulans]|uniref:EVE domain-containing protein n=1 Tax=Pokkaliibacter plantistimulans TaxID=1635171 RepID=A0ABX5M2H3_9GAMM|nr:EVE domain-containing protein [Pokkaliibacter plantistimulans]PXF33082.1 EVE domain-containing protein [Pokkaliibacter plantistimulans]
MTFWLLKSEPDTFGIEHLERQPDQRSGWDGVRNYQARNFLRDQIKLGDLAFFYHSSCPQPGIVGIVEIVREGYPDPSAFDPTSKYFDAKSEPGKVRWYQVDVQLREKFTDVIPLQALKLDSQLASMPLINRSRLSVQPVSEEHWRHILSHYSH